MTQADVVLQLMIHSVAKCTRTPEPNSIVVYRHA